MADAAPDTTDLEPLYRQMLQQTLAPQAVPAPQGPSPSSHEGRGWLSLLGEALGGGQEYGTTAERETGGIRALGALGQRMLAASDYSYQPHTLGSIIGQGMGAAGESLAQTGSVDAARVAALQDYQDKQQTMQLARVKEAIPILTQLQELRKQKALAGLGSPFSTPGTTPGTSIGAVSGDDGLTGDKAHDLPLIAKRESGGDPTALNYVAKADPTAYERGATASGKYQIVNSTWREGMQLAGIDPSKFATARDAPESVQDQVASALYDKYGNKPWQKGSQDWVKDEGGRYQLATVKPPAGTPGAPKPTPVASTAQAAAPTVPGGGGPLTPPGAPQPSPTSAIAEATRAAEVGPLPLPATAGKGTTLPAGNLQTTGKPPGVASNAEAIQAGINLAQATPVVPGTGLAAGPPGIGQPATLASVVPGADAGFAPTAPPAAPAPQAPTQAQQPPATPPVVTTGAIPRSTPDAVPDTFEEYQAQHPIVPSDEDRRSFSTDPDAAQLGVLQRQAQIAKYAMDVARTQGDAAGLAKASEAYNTILASENTVREAAAKAGADRRAAFMKDQGANQFNAWKAAQDEKQKRITQQQQNDAAAALERMRGEESRKTENVKAENVYVGKERERFGLERDGARTSIDSLQMLRALSDNAGTTTPLDNIVVGNMTGRDFMANIGMGTQAQREKWGAQQAFIAAKNQMVIELRKGVQMGALSDRDMGFLQAMGPDLLQSPQTRASILQLLESAQIRKLRYMDAVEELHDGGMGWGRAKREADKQLGPMLTTVPKEYPTWSGKEKQKFFEDHIPSRTVYRDSDGNLAVAP